MIKNSVLYTFSRIITPKTNTENITNQIVPIVCIIILLCFFGVVLWSFIRYRHNQKKGSELLESPAAIIEKYATILEKNVVMEHTGTARLPSHQMLYIVTFQFDNGTKTSLPVPPEIFDVLLVGSRDILVTQDGLFVDFGRSNRVFRQENKQ